MIWIDSHAHRQYACIKVPVKNSLRVQGNTSNDFSQQAEVEPQGVRDPCSSAQVTLNFRVPCALRGVLLRGVRWAQPAAIQESSEDLSWYHIGSWDDWLWLVNLHPGHNRCEAILANYRVILVFLRLCSYPYQTGSRSSRCGQGVPDHLESLLLFKDKKNG